MFIPLPGAQMAVIFSTFTALGVIPLYTLGFLPSVGGLANGAGEVSLWCMAAGLLGLLLGMRLWRPGKTVFIDKVCLNAVESVEGLGWDWDGMHIMSESCESCGVWKAIKLAGEVV